MLKTVDTFLRETKILRFVIGIPVAYLLIKVFGFFMHVATLLDNGMI